MPGINPQRKRPIFQQAGIVCLLPASTDVTYPPDERCPMGDYTPWEWTTIVWVVVIVAVIMLALVLYSVFAIMAWTS